MLDSWWHFGDWSGLRGNQLELNIITCPFCEAIGVCSVIYHIEKVKPNGKKKLNYEVLQCGNCGNYNMVFWSANEHSISSRHSLYNYLMIPYPLRIDNQRPEWPTDVFKYWSQAHSNLRLENYEAAATMARSTLQIALRSCNAQGKDLKEEINDLSDKGILPVIMKDWSHSLRMLGNDTAHPQPGDELNPADVKDVIKFIDFLLEYLFTLPNNISEYRKRQNGNTESD
ncbi:MAG TPA: DUF4145 domain-containing protein [Candidatus Cloacimonadota bacterium]|nr:DUF4145 domain-containing protein [Candidatus Cloacimonadota bacterium]HQL15560.1 DUF4145 domain-containing protein [Candidatus Cloacimonadota bacterium]